MSIAEQPAISSKEFSISLPGGKADGSICGVRLRIIKTSRCGCMRNAKGPNREAKIPGVMVFINGNNHLTRCRIVSHHAVQGLPHMSWIDLFHLDDADLTHSDAVKNYLDDPGDVALIPQEAEIISFRRHLPHHTRFTGRHLADDGREDWIFSVRDRFHFEIRIEQPFGNVTR